MKEEITKEAIALIADQAIKPLITKLVKSFTNWMSKKDVESKLHDYYKDSFVKCYIAHTILVNSPQYALEDIYIPLTIQSKSDSNKSILIDKFPVLEFSELKYILVEDSAGMGKSTITKIMYLDLLKNDNLQPILIELRKIKNGESLVQVIANEIFKSIDTIYLSAVDQLLKSKKTVVFLDGYDEISLEAKHHVTQEIKAHCIINGLHSVILTSRAEDGLITFSQFHKFRINEFTKDEAFSLLRKFDNKTKIAEELIIKVSEDHYKDIQDYLKNPLLTTLLFNVYNSTNDIPLKKNLFYSAIYTTLFFRHDFGKDRFIREKRSNLNIDDFEKVLMYLGYASFKKSFLEFEEINLKSIIEDIKEIRSLKFDVNDLISDLTESVPLFVRDGQTIRWIHKTIIEYFTALYIFNVTKNKKDAFQTISKNSDPINVMDIFYDLDLNYFEEIFVDSIIQDYFKYKKLLQEEFPGLDNDTLVLISEYFSLNILIFTGVIAGQKVEERTIEYFKEIEPKKFLLHMHINEDSDFVNDPSTMFVGCTYYSIAKVLKFKKHRILKAHKSNRYKNDESNFFIHNSSISELKKIDRSNLQDVVLNLIKVMKGSGFGHFALIISDTEAKKYLNKINSRESNDVLFD